VVEQGVGQLLDRERVGSRAHWGSAVGFIMSAAGCAIGLGNVWRFPYLAAQSGGSAFILVYLFFVLFLGVPLLMAELLLGRATQRNPVGAFRLAKPGSYWFLLGGMGVIAGGIILSFYSVVAGWSIAYVVKSVTGNIMVFRDPSLASEAFDKFTGGNFQPLFYHALFLALCALIVAAGIKSGIERWNRILMPVLLVILVVLVFRSITLKGSLRGVEFLLRPDFGKLSPEIILAALGQACFTLSLGIGAMMTYGSYLSADSNIPRSALWIAGLDTAIALLAGLAIFPALFAMGLSPDAQGPGLIFKILPSVFARMPAAGRVISFSFFFLLFLAALTTGISLLEIIVAYMVDERRWRRRTAAWVSGGLVFLWGIPSALSYGALHGVRLFGKTFFGLMDYTASNVLLPSGILMISLFVGWFWGRERVRREMFQGAEGFRYYRAWSFFVRFVAPVLVAVVALQLVFAG